MAVLAPQLGVDKYLVHCGGWFIHQDVDMFYATSPMSAKPGIYPIMHCLEMINLEERNRTDPMGGE